jgi:hypothetical protein
MFGNQQINSKNAKKDEAPPDKPALPMAKQRSAIGKSQND